MPLTIMNADNNEYSSRKRKRVKIPELNVPSLPLDIYRKIINETINSKSILSLKNSNKQLESLIRDQASVLTTQQPITLDIPYFFRENNPFVVKYFDSNNREHVRQLHDDIRKLCNFLEEMSNIGRFSVDNLTAEAIGWIKSYDEIVMKRAPFMLQKRLVQILKRFHGSRQSIGGVFMRPSRFIATFSNRFETIKELDLAQIRPLAVLKLREIVFPALVNLEKLTWHHANHKMLKKLQNRKKMKKLVITIHPKGSPRYTEFQDLTEFENLEEFYLGFTVPLVPSRMVMDVLLNLYQAIWKKNLGESSDILISYYKNIKEIGFWNAPEKIFIDMTKRGIEVDTMNFGIASPDLKKLCSFDSIMQALFKFEEAEISKMESPKISNLNMNLHAMPVVHLEYYLPNLMQRINKMAHLKTVSIFVNCIFHSEMSSSWSLESKSAKSKRAPIHNATYTSFSFSSNGLCVLTDLDRQLPSTLQKCSISLSLPSESASKAVRTIPEFLRKLSDMNSFPDLEEVHLQIWGVRCLEALVDAICETIGGFLKRLSIIAMPKCEDRHVARSLVEQIGKHCRKLERLDMACDFWKIICDEEKLIKDDWKTVLNQLARPKSLPNCRVAVGKLPDIPGFFVKPEFEANYEEMSEIDGEKEEEEMEEEEDEDDSFVADEDETLVENMSMDELDLLEQKLENESKRRDKRWERKRVRMEEEEESEPEPEPEIEEDEEEEYEEKRKRNVFLDDEAEESDGEEVEDESEPEGEDLYDSDDERLFAKSYQRNGKKPAVKKNKIIIIDSDSEDDCQILENI